MKNPAWEKVEAIRLEKEAKYAAFMKSSEALKLREEDFEGYRNALNVLNAEIEEANKQTRTIPQEV